MDAGQPKVLTQNRTSSCSGGSCGLPELPHTFVQSPPGST